MYSHQPEPLTPLSAKSIAREWIDNQMAKPTKAYTWSQMCWLMDELGNRCVAESLRLGEDENGLCERLDRAHGIIFSAWYCIAPEYAKGWRVNDQEEPSLEEQEKIEKAQHVLWTRRDPKRSFAEGALSAHYTSFDRDSFYSTIADYLNQPYLRHPVLDWIFLDMTISRELSAFGESLKEIWLPGKRDPLLGIHSRYLETQGNLAEMTKIDWNEVFERWNAWFWWALGFPIAAIWASFYWHYTTLGVWIAAIYAAILITFFSIKLLRLMARLIRRLAGQTDPHIRVFRLWEQMYEVWTQLGGPIVNPALVREAMVKSREQGAVWDTVCWSLIDRVIATDPAVWVVQPGRRGL